MIAKKRLLPVLIAVLMVFVMMPSQVFADEEKLPAPTDLKWGDGNHYPTDALFRWDNEDLNDVLAGFHVNAKWKSGEESDTDVGGPAYKYGEVVSKDFSDFFEEHGEGKYSFYTYAVPNEGTGYENSDTVESEPVQFYKVNINIDSEDEDAGAVYVKRGESSERKSDGENVFYQENSAMEFEAVSYIGYEFEGFTFDSDPADKTTEGNSVTFTLDKSVKLTAKFTRNEARSAVSLDLGAKHAASATALAGAINDPDGDYYEYGNMNAVADGSVISISFPKAGATEYDVMDYLNDAVKDYLSDEEYEDAGERLAAYYSVAKKTVTEYADEEKVDDEWDDARETELGDTLSLNVLWAVPAEKADFTVKKLIIGSSMTANIDGNGIVQSPALQVTADESSQLYIRDEVPAYWVNNGNYSEVIMGLMRDDPLSVLVSGDITEGGNYYAFLPGITEKLGYFINEENLPTVTVNGEEVNIISEPGPFGRSILTKVDAVTAEKYGLYVQGVQVSELNKDDVLEDGTVSYDSESKVLTLNNADITQGSSTSSSSNHYRKGIYTTIDGLTIDLVGDNKVSANALQYYSSKNARGISSEGKLTITGAGTLDVEILNNDPDNRVRDKNACGIYADTLDIDSTKVSITNTGGCKYDDPNDSASGIYVMNGVSIIDSDVDIKMVAGSGSTATGIYCYNDNKPVSIQGDSDVDIVLENETEDTSHVVTGISGRYVNGSPMYNRHLVMLNATGTSKLDIDSTGASTYYANGGIYAQTTVDDTAKVNIKAGKSRGGDNPSYGIGPWTQVATSGGTSGSQYYVGLKAKGNSVVTLDAKDNAMLSSVDASGNAKVTLKGGTNGTKAYQGVKASDSAEVVAIGGTYGISGLVMVKDDAVVEATGGTRAVNGQNSPSTVGQGHKPFEPSTDNDGSSVHIKDHNKGTADVNTEATATGSSVWNGEDVLYGSETTFKYVRIPAHDHEWRDATCTEPKTCERCGITEGEALGHAWGEPEYVWADDNGSVTATRVCSLDDTHIETETVASSKVTKAPTCIDKGETTYTSAEFENQAFEVQSKTLEDADALGHDWGEWTVTKQPTETAKGMKTRTCKRCDETESEEIPAKGYAPGEDPNQKGTDGTAVGPGASAASADKAITGMTSDKDPKGSVYSKLKLMSTRQTKTAITLKWSKPSKAAKYVLYGNKCGARNKMKKLGTYTGSSKKLTKVAGKKIKKGTYYKFIMVALDKNKNVVSTSKVIHIATKGGKVTNPKKVTVKKGKKAVTRFTVKKGRAVTVKSKVTKASKKLKLKTHRKVKYESSNKKIATVTSAGKIKGVKKGTCYIYAYAQNGVNKKVKVIVK